MLPTVISMRELIESFDKKSGVVLADTRKMFGELSQSINAEQVRRRPAGDACQTVAFKQEPKNGNARRARQTNRHCRRPPATVTRAESTVPRHLRKYLSLDDFEATARRRIPKFLYGYISGGAETDAAVRDNRAAFDQYGFVPRVLNDVSGRDQTTTLFGKTYASPFGIPPMGSSALCAYRGDIVLRAGRESRKRADDPQRLVADHAGGRARAPTRPRGTRPISPALPERIEPLVDRVAAAGYDTFVVTADVPVPPNRENNIRNGFQVPMAITPQIAWDTVTHPHWLFGTWARTVKNFGMPHFENMDAKRGPPVMAKNLMRNIGARDQLAWKHVELIRKQWKGKLVVKGLVSPADARIARESGVDGLMLSNHGGRQLDYTMSACARCRRSRLKPAA